MSSFDLWHVCRHAWMSLGKRLETISMRSSLESEKMGGGDATNSGDPKPLASLAILGSHAAAVAAGFDLMSAFWMMMDRVETWVLYPSVYCPLKLEACDP
jgi:hypothetical protein